MVGSGLFYIVISDYVLVNFGSIIYFSYSWLHYTGTKDLGVSYIIYF